MYILAEIDFSTFVPVAAALAVAALVFLAIDALSGSKTKAESRLDEINGDAESVLTKQNPFAAFVRDKAPAFGKSIMPTKEADMSKLKERLSHAGFRTDEAPAIFLGLKVMACLAGFFLLGGASLFSFGFNNKGILWLICGTGIMYFLPEFIMSFLISKRKEGVFLGLPDALDLMVVCVEAGLALDQAMRKVSEEMIKSHPIIAEEFSQCNMQLQMGKPRSQVLHDLGARTGVEDLSQLASVLVQADKFGSSVAQALRVQSDSMRVRRRQIAEEKAAKTAVQLIFPLVIFIFPAIFVVLVGPAAIRMAETLMPAMN